MTIEERRMFVMTDARNNHNKFWEITRFSGGEVKTRWGRVGTSGSETSFGNIGWHGMEAKIREKTSKGYREVALAEAPAETSATLVKEVAKRQIVTGNPVLESLIERLADANRHQILVASGGKIEVDIYSGVLRTPVGIVTATNISQARRLLDSMATFVKRSDFEATRYVDALDEYLMLVPQKVGASRGWHRDVLPDMPAVERQADFLDQLEAALRVSESQIEAAQAAAAGKVPQIFDVKLSLIEDKATLARINKFHWAGASRQHASNTLKPIKVYGVDIASMSRNFEKDLGNVQELWHGTRTHNVLSILKAGLVIPKSGGSIQVTGRMFGDGLYFSDQSTKSLNYSYGYWDGGLRDSNCFMFLADVAMGKSHVPARTGDSRPRGYDSTFAKANVSGVRNNEMIVYRISQANLKYLVEFSN